MLWVLLISVFLLGYIYAGYPIVIHLLASVRGRPVRKGSYEGGVSILISAHNEAEALPQKLQALLDLAGAEPIREIILGLDGCTDDTAQRVKEVIQQRLQQGESSIQGAQPVVHVEESEGQRGKAAMLNVLMKQATQPILVMMDARQGVEPGAISHLLENFADEQVGVVSGALIYQTAKGGAQKGADSYWGYEKHLRRCESQFWAVPGATGALYAIRKELCQPIPENTLVDDVLIPMRAVLSGFRCLFEPKSRVFDIPTDHFEHETVRKRRTLAGIWQIWRLEPQIFSIFANPIWFQWISHKFLRLLTPFVCLLAYISLSVVAWEGCLSWKVLFWASTVGGVSSFVAYLWGRRVPSRWLGLLGAVWGVNLALTQAAMDAWTGRFNSRWKF